VTHASQRFRVVRVDPRDASVLVVWKREDGTLIGNVGAAIASGRRIVFATNAGIFSPERIPLGLFVQNGKERVPLNTSEGSGNFYLQPNGVFAIQGNHAAVTTTSAYTGGTPLTAVQSGPMLLINGAINAQFDPRSENRKVRSAVGVGRSGEVVFVLSESPVTFYELATLYRDRLDCPNALYLDGTISRFMVPSIDASDSNESFAGMFVVAEKK
jgi:uncharacterized protein YigE (DUF2233 family)